jgi:hypothetical protein
MNGIELNVDNFSVIKVCPSNVKSFSESCLCSGCGKCRGQKEVLRYSVPEKDYLKKLQGDIDLEIESLMQKYAATREQVVEALLEDELERIKKGRG